MTPHLANNRGSFVLDRQVKGVGRIRRASGTADPKLFKLLDAMLGTLKQAGRVDLLKAIRSGALTPLEVWAQFRVSDLDALPSSDTMRPLKGALQAWLKDGETGKHNLASRRYAVAAILRHAAKDATVADLAPALSAFRKKATGPTMFNRARAAALAFVRDELGRSHPIYGRLRDVRTMKEARKPGNPLTPAQLTELAEKLGTCGVNAWGMCLTGMGPGEWWGRWKVLADRIHVHGTKREGRDRDIPLILPIGRPVGTYATFRKALKAASGDTVTCYDFRRTYATWMEQAGILRALRKAYMGQGTTDVLDLYERVQVERFLAEDAEKLRKVVGDVPARGLRLA